VISCLIIVTAMRGFPRTQRTDRRWIPKTVNHVPWSISANNMKPLRGSYNVEVAGNFAGAQLATDYIEANGIKLPSRRRTFAMGPDRRPIPELLMVAIDLSMSFTAPARRHGGQNTIADTRSAAFASSEQVSPGVKWRVLKGGIYVLLRF
jgi:hypothetical protein